MKDAEVAIWGIHAGRMGDADTLFLKKNYVAIGKFKMGDLSKIPNNREAFKAKVAECYPDIKPGAIPNYAGQTYRFVHEMKQGDLVVYPSKSERQVHIGEIIGPYQYNDKIEPNYPNLRPVKWLRSLSRTYFTQGALYEIGSALSLFQVKNYAEEFGNALMGKVQPKPAKKDETVEFVSERIEMQTHDFILKNLAQELKGHPLEHFVAHLLEIMGYRTRISPEGSDGGIDIIAHKDELGFEPPIIKVQVKSSDGNVSDHDVSALYGKVGANEFGLLVSLGAFTLPAKNFARTKSNLRLIDSEELVNLILQYYDKFDPSYKSLLPLKRVYIPDLPLVSEDEDTN